MPTKENSAGRQQPYDPNSGEYGEGSSASKGGKEQPKPSVKESKASWGTSFATDFGGGREAYFADRSKAQAALDDWESKSSEIGLRAESVVGKAKDGEEITKEDAETLSKAYSSLGSRVYLSAMKNSMVESMNQVLSLSGNPSLSSIIDAGGGDYVSETVFFGKDGTSLEFSPVTRRDISPYFISKGITRSFGTLKEAKESIAKADSFIRSEKERRKSLKDEYSRITDPIKALGFLSDPSNEGTVVSDRPLYDDESKDSSKGGYEGNSMSNRAVKAYENGQKPLSRWKKQDVMDTIESLAPELAPFSKIISSMSEKEVKANLLEQSSWHHTGALFNATDFYGVKSPKDIIAYIRYKTEEGR